MPNDAFTDMSGPKSWAVSIVLGLVGAFVGYLIFTSLLGIGDDDAFDLGGILSAIIGVVIVLLVAGAVIRRSGTGGTSPRGDRGDHALRLVPGQRAPQRPLPAVSENRRSSSPAPSSLGNSNTALARSIRRLCGSAA